MDELEIVILNKVRELDSLEREYLKYSYECKKPGNSKELEAFLRNALGLAQKAFVLKNEIKIEFTKITDLAVDDPSALKIIDKIKNDEKFYSISFYENIAEMVNKDIDNWNDRIDLSIRDYLLSEKYDKLFAEFHTWFDVCNYYDAKMSIGAIISSAIVPEKIKPYFDELRETYAFEQHRASIALCRALLEMALFEKLSRLKAFTNRPQLTDISPEKEGNLFQYIKMAKNKKILNRSEIDSAHDIRKFCNKILHMTKCEVKPNHSETHRIIIDTISLIESAYRN